MPIRPAHRWLYPINWRELSAAIRFRRARGRCESCGRPHGRIVLHLGDGPWWDGPWWDEDAGRWRDRSGRWVRRLPSPCNVVDRIRHTQVMLATCHRAKDAPELRRWRTLTMRAQRVGVALLGTHASPGT